MLILGVPDIVVRERIDVHIELATIVDVDVDNGDLYDEPSIALPTQ